MDREAQMKGEDEVCYCRTPYVLAASESRHRAVGLEPVNKFARPAI